MTFPDMRQVDLDAEAARLAELRSRNPDNAILCDEVRQVWDGSEHRLVHIRVTADKAPDRIPAGLAQLISDMVGREVWS